MVMLNRTSKVKSNVTENGRKVYEIGPYAVYIDPDGNVSYLDRRRRGYGDPFADIVGVSYGQLTIHLEDLVDIIVARSEPPELAEALMRNDEVRQEFLERLVTNVDSGFSKSERLDFAKSIGKGVENQNLNKLMTIMAKLEYSASQRSSFYHQINVMNYRLRRLDVRDPYSDTGGVLQFKHDHEDETLGVGNSNWREAFEFWREDALKTIKELLNKQKED